MKDLTIQLAKDLPSTAAGAYHVYVVTGMVNNDCSCGYVHHADYV